MESMTRYRMGWPVPWSRHCSDVKTALEWRQTDLLTDRKADRPTALNSGWEECHPLAPDTDRHIQTDRLIDTKTYKQTY